LYTPRRSNPLNETIRLRHRRISASTIGSVRFEPSRRTRWQISRWFPRRCCMDGGQSSSMSCIHGVNSVRASEPRTSPTTMRSGRCEGPTGEGHRMSERFCACRAGPRRIQHAACVYGVPRYPLSSGRARHQEWRQPAHSAASSCRFRPPAIRMFCPFPDCVSQGCSLFLCQHFGSNQVSESEVPRSKFTDRHQWAWIDHRRNHCGHAAAVGKRRLSVASRRRASCRTIGDDFKRSLEGAIFEPDASAR